LVADVTTFPDILRGAVMLAPDISDFYDGYVPEKVAETDGYIDPYVVLWAGLGENPFEPTACGIHSTDTVVWDFQTTVVGADANICRRAAREVRNRLVNLVVGTGRVIPNPDGFHQQTPILDTQTTPARFMLPLQWRITTN
jgi:hypothetical protein